MLARLLYSQECISCTCLITGITLLTVSNEIITHVVSLSSLCYCLLSLLLSYSTHQKNSSISLTNPHISDASMSFYTSSTTHYIHAHYSPHSSLNAKTETNSTSTSLHLYSTHSSKIPT